MFAAVKGLSPLDSDGGGGGGRRESGWGKNGDQKMAPPAGQSQEKLSELASQFNDSAIHPKDFKIIINGKTLSADPSVSIGAPVYVGASTSDVISYFKQLTGLAEMPGPKSIAGKGDVYAATISSGSNAGSKITLRNFSNSTESTGAKWTIDIINPAINSGKRVEIKFK